MTGKPFVWLGRLVKEAYLLGWRGTLFRCAFELRRRLGLDALLKCPVDLDVRRYLETCGLSTDEEEYLKEWRSSKADFGLPVAAVARPVLRDLIDDTRAVVDRATAISEGRFPFFHHKLTRYPDTALWSTDPQDGRKWPTEHSSRLLLRLEDYGDIKLVWELGRFAWILDLIRAWIVDGDSEHLAHLFELVDSFSTENPLYLGVHWASEQEVAIRALMLIFAQEVLREEEMLDGRRLQRLHALLELHGRYLDEELYYAEYAIRNNHLIHGSLGLLAVGHALSWHPDAERWCRRGRDLLLEATREQWYDDGGYVQPSHNYHRSAWHGMLWARSIAEARGDRDLESAIEARARPALDFFLAQIDPGSGRLPNWGPNDGTLIGAWTECEYSDYRPVIQSLAYLSGTPLPFDPGPWDEEVFWFFGPDAVEADRVPPELPGRASFPVQGLHVIRTSASRFGVLRCGSVRSRYGQQADQLHVDLWNDGENVALDAGSYNYSQNPRIHDWFRGTASHNTIRIAGEDQMVPVRKFKYLRWVRASGRFCNVPCTDSAVVGVHDGYTRLKGRWVHARMLAAVGAFWVVVDRVWPLLPRSPETRLELHWQLAPGTAVENPEGLVLTTGQQQVFVSVASGSDEGTRRLFEGSEFPFEGWHSRHYNFREEVPAFLLSVDVQEEHWFATTFGPSFVQLRFDRSAARLGIASVAALSLEPLIELAPSLLPPSMP